MEESHENKEEISMVISNLRQLQEIVSDILELLEETDEIPEWAQEAIAIAAHDLEGIRGFMKHNPEALHKDEEEEDVTDSGTLEEGSHVCMGCVLEQIQKTSNLLLEAEYRGRKVPLGKPMRGDVKKFKVYVKDPKTGNVKKVNFGDPNMRIKKSNPARRKSFRARHNCDNPGPRTKARFWSCRAWE